MKRETFPAIFLILILLGFMAYMYPTIANLPDSNNLESSEIELNHTEIFDSQIRVESTDIDDNNDTASFTVTDLNSFSQTTITDLNEDETTDISLGDNDISITLDRVDGNLVTITIEFSRFYGWDDGAVTFYEYIHLIYLAVMVIIGTVLIALVVRG